VQNTQTTAAAAAAARSPLSWSRTEEEEGDLLFACVACRDCWLAHTTVYLSMGRGSVCLHAFCCCVVPYDSISVDEERVCVCVLPYDSISVDVERVCVCVWCAVVWLPYDGISVDEERVCASVWCDVVWLPYDGISVDAERVRLGNCDSLRWGCLSIQFDQGLPFLHAATAATGAWCNACMCLC
jgi:hypothetical protein